MPDRVAQILVAGVGNAWMRDDGFGGEVVKELLSRSLPDGVSVLDFGTGGLNLAYEVMRGYDGLVLVDASRQGEAPGTLYVMEADEGSVEQGIADGEMLDPHDMDPRAVLRFVRAVGGWPGKVMVIACEPADADQPGLGLSDAVQASVARAADAVLETAAEIALAAVAADAESDEATERGRAAARAEAAAARAASEAARDAPDAAAAPAREAAPAPATEPPHA